MTVLLVALGAAVGASLRFLLARLWPSAWSTLVVNVVGCAVLGLLVHPSMSTAALVGTGFTGGLTTYSTFAVEVAQTRSWRFTLASLVLGIGAAALSRALAH